MAISMVELAQSMLEWRELKLKLDALEHKIKDAVIQGGKTVDVGDVRASYRKPRRTWDYQTPGIENAPEEVIQKYTKTVTTITTDWRAICREIGVEGNSEVTGKASVIIKILGQS